MKALEKYFDLTIDTPQGVDKLRELILKLAMRGRLVPQNTTDETGYSLIEKIKEERNLLIKNKAIRKQESHPPIKKTDIPVAIPDSWIWVTLNDYGTWQSGSTPSRNNSSFYGGAIPWVKSGEVKQGKIKETSETITKEALIKCSLNINPTGSILIAMYGANIGEVGILEIEAATNQAVCACKTYSGIDNTFLLYLIQSLKSYFISQGAGAAQPNISREKIIRTIVPLPPYNEQIRIVNKIEELMNLCDQLEKQKYSKIKLLSNINDSAINKLINTELGLSFKEAINFIHDKFDDLYSTESTVEGLRKAILNLGISGKFEIDSINSKHTKKFTAISKSEEPFKLPENWIWTKLDSVGETQTGTTPPKKTPEYFGDYIPFLGPGDIKDLKINYSNAALSKLGIEKARFIAANSILMVCIGGSIGKMAINDRDVTCNQQINTITPYEGVDLNYLSAVLQSEYFQNKILLSAGGSATPIINKGKWISIPIPLPPLDMQIEISNKIDTLLSFCCSLENSFSQVSEKQTQILDSVLANI
jgi:type I restriction enzyme, S subunit